MARAIRHLLLLASLLAADLVHGAAAQSSLEATEAGVKAAFLYKFAAYIEWPAASLGPPEAPFVYGVAGQDEVAAELARVTAGRKIAGHPITVRRVEGDNVKDLRVLFIGAGANGRLGTLLRAAQLPGLLVVAENERALGAGAAINFVLHDDRIGFEVAPDAAERNGLRISSRMLAVARRVVQR